MYHVSGSVARKLSLAIWVLSFSFSERAIAMSVAEATAETTCVTLRDSSSTQAGHAFIQVKRSAKDPNGKKPTEAALLFGRSDARGIGDTAPLTMFGYNQVQRKCCTAEMQKFIRRVIVDKHGLVVCTEGGLAGFAPWFDCLEDKTNFTVLEAAISDPISKERIGDCPWIGEPNNCPNRMPPPTCPSFPDEPPLLQCKGCSIAGSVPLDFASATVAINNLAGVGPDTGKAPIIFYQGIGTFGSPPEPFNMIIKELKDTGGNYEAAHPEQNGLGSTGDRGVVNMKAGHSIDMKVELQKADGSALKLPEFHFTIWDLDGESASSGQPASAEYITVKGFSDYVLDESTDLAVSYEDTEAKMATFHNSKIMNNDGAISMNGKLLVLDAKARKAAVMMVFRKVSEFQMTFRKSGTPGAGGSGLVFNGACSLEDQCED